ncbi:MAG: hypothetical protein DWQ02_28765 [Bacteroidetes bacterium]|nr:MAG: hypothetical protein DWQ02_28765 [Bacteroidota bacterium]
MEQKFDFIFLEQFIKRIPMYTGEEEQSLIVAFVHGYEAGKANKNLTDEISKILNIDYGISKPAVGWPYQVKVYSEKNNCSWVEGFKAIIQEIIFKHRTSYA